LPVPNIWVFSWRESRPLLPRCGCKILTKTITWLPKLLLYQ
jgi:hypothetical protein